MARNYNPETPNLIVEALETLPCFRLINILLNNKIFPAQPFKAGNNSEDLPVFELIRTEIFLQLC